MVFLAPLLVSFTFVFSVIVYVSLLFKWNDVLYKRVKLSLMVLFVCLLMMYIGSKGIAA